MATKIKQLIIRGLLLLFYFVILGGSLLEGLFLFFEELFKSERHYLIC